MEKKEFMKFTVLTLLTATCLSLGIRAQNIKTENQNATLNDAEAFGEEVVPYIKLSFKKNYRFHMYNIKTIFDMEGEDFQKSVDVRRYEKHETRRIFFHNNNSWSNVKCYVWNAKDNNNYNHAFPGQDMVKVKDSNYYYLDINKNADKVIFSENGDANKEHKTSDLDLATSNIVTTYNGKDNKWDKNSPICFDDNNSQYFWEATATVYDTGGTNMNGYEFSELTYGKNAAGQIVNQTFVNNANKFDSQGYYDVHLPFFVKSFDLDIMQEVIRGKEKTHHILKLENPVHIENDNDGVNKRVEFLSKEYPDNQFTRQAKVSDITKTSLKESNAHYDFLINYFKSIKHSVYNDKANSICNSLTNLDKTQLEALKTLISKYDALTPTGKDLLAKSLDKYQEDGTKVSIKETMEYVKSIVSHSNVGDAMYGLLDDQGYVPMVILSGTFALLIAVVSLSIIFAKKKKEIK